MVPGALALMLTPALASAAAPRVAGSVQSSDLFEGSDDGMFVAAEAEEVESSSLPWIGLILDAGVPDGANLGLVARPFSWLRLHAGGSYNLVSAGVRGGVSYVPFNYWIVPTLTVEGGHFFDGNARSSIKAIAGLDVEYAPEKVSYTYANGHLGLEFGGDWYTIFLRGGMSFVHASVRPPSQDDVRFEEDVTITAWAPSAKLGFIVYVN